MASNGVGNSTRSNATSINAAATAIGSTERFPLQQRRRRWGGCWGGLSCFRSQKGGKRIVPATRLPDGGNSSANRANGPEPVGLPNQATALTPSLLAPPSSPASFTNSAIHSTAQSPSCFLSANACSPRGPTSTMFATGPYAHETQLVSPPVFSTFTTEPSTAPLTPPPELAHLTTPSSPDVPFAQLLSSSLDLKVKTTSKENGVNSPFASSGYVSAVDLQATYQLYPGSPASNLLSPISRSSGDGLSSSFPDQEFPAQWGASVSTKDAHFPKNESSKLFGLDITTSKNFMLSQDSSFFCPATSAQFYLDQARPHSGGRLSLSREADAYSSGGNTHQNRHNKTCKPDVEEIEAYRASFGFSADEIISTPHYVELSDVLEDSFTMSPFPANNICNGEYGVSKLFNGGEKLNMTQSSILDHKGSDLSLNPNVEAVGSKMQKDSGREDADKLCKQSQDFYKSNWLDNYSKTNEGKHFSNTRNRNGLSSSDTEIDYRRESGRKLAADNSNDSFN